MSASANPYRMPAEWEPHEAIWVQAPNEQMRSTPSYCRRMYSAWLEMIAVVADYVPVRVLVASDHSGEFVERDCLRFGLKRDHVQVVRIPLNDVWARDTGPILVKDHEGYVHATDWNFNGWGEPAARIDYDAQIPTAVAQAFGMRLHQTSIVTEGGALEVNGHGTLLATRSSILNPNRNPGKSQAEVEAELARWLGITHFVWLSGATPEECYAMGDATDFHIDLVARFAPSGAILANSAAEPTDPRAPYMERHLNELRSAVDGTGKPFVVISLPAPHMVSTTAITFSGTIKPVPPGSPTDASYSNYLVTNGVVVVPVYGRNEDQEALSSPARALSWSGRGWRVGDQPF
jgi:agmatine deiminase